MTYKTYGRISATMPGGITAEASRVDLNAFGIVCFVWPSMPKDPAPEQSTEKQEAVES